MKKYLSLNYIVIANIQIIDNDMETTINFSSIALIPKLFLADEN